MPFHANGGRECRVEVCEVFGGVVEEVIPVSVFQSEDAVSPCGDIAYGEVSVFIGTSHA